MIPSPDRLITFDYDAARVDNGETSLRQFLTPIVRDVADKVSADDESIAFNICDLCAGTGLFSAFVVNLVGIARPPIQLHLVDINTQHFPLNAPAGVAECKQYAINLDQIRPLETVDVKMHIVVMNPPFKKTRDYCKSALTIVDDNGGLLCVLSSEQATRNMALPRMELLYDVCVGITFLYTLEWMCLCLFLR